MLSKGSQNIDYAVLILFCLEGGIVSIENGISVCHSGLNPGAGGNVRGCHLAA